MNRRRPLLLTLAVAAVALAGCAAPAAEAPKGPGVPAPRVTATAAPAPAAQLATAPMPRSKPVRVRVPSAGVDARPLLDLGLNPDGTVQVPSVAQAGRIGWYDKGVTPGETGPAVLIGHYDTAEGPAVLKDVARIRVGDRITVTRADGTDAVFRVRELEQVDKKAFPTRKVYGDTRRPELRLITCGGELVDGHRPDNIVVYADLLTRAA
ncbi:class F sortase [Streptomyces showdoensis]|uniref:Peptidase C60 n=1 Tax=Streptomyces showdoensis TaxID=68268 RepID=A0A2P2GMV1_STREW|nr:class F sortase [Streptomyces showdoensis]KKZ72843.1 peptidase C60 [Streptomyces showdoensis]